MLVSIVAVAIGIALLWFAADAFVDGAAAIAAKMQISPVVVGAVIVGFGTSAPEMLVSGLAAGRGDLDLGVGNVVGSNVANLSLVLGVAALIAAIPVARVTLRRELPMSVVAVVIFAVLVQGGLTRGEGALLAVLLVVSLSAILWLCRNDDIELEIEADEVNLGVEALRAIVGLVGTVAGAWLLVYGATDIADELGLSGGFVGLTLVAIGTSLPELVTAVAAARKGQTDLIIGNLLGSNLFNSFAVGAVIGLIGPGPLEDGTLAGLATIIMLAIVIAAGIFMVTESRVVRWEALALLAAYLVTMPFTISEEVDCDEEPTAVACIEAALPPDDARDGLPGP